MRKSAFCFALGNMISSAVTFAVSAWDAGSISSAATFAVSVWDAGSISSVLPQPVRVLNDKTRIKKHNIGDNILFLMVDHLHLIFNISLSGSTDTVFNSDVPAVVFGITA